MSDETTCKTQGQRLDNLASGFVYALFAIALIDFFLVFKFPIITK